jgi:organic radical activating enzyme
MDEMHEIYKKTKASLETILARHVDDLTKVKFILDNNIVSSNGDPMAPDELADVTKSLHDQMEQTVETVCTIKEQIKYFDGWLITH